MRPLPLAILLVGCAQVSVGGLVAGATPQLVDAVYSVDRDAFVDDDALRIQLTSFPEACTALTTYAKAVNRIAPGLDPDSGQADQLADAWREAFPETGWRVELQLRRSDPDDALERLTLDGTDWERAPAKGDEFKATVIEYRRYLDDDYFSGDAPVGEYLKTWVNDEGVLDADRRERDGVLTGRLSVDVVDADDGAEEGTLEVSFRARYCSDLDRRTSPDPVD